MLSQDVCLSVRLSVTRRYCVETAKRIIELFHLWVATPFYFFSVSNLMAIFRRVLPRNRGVECLGYENTRFSATILVQFRRTLIDGAVLSINSPNSLYLQNDARYGHSDYGMRIGNRTQAFE